MADFQTVMDHVAQVVGGNQPDATNKPRWFSGDSMNNGAGDGSGLQPGAGYPTFKGCYSAPPEAIEDVPIGLVLPGAFKVEGAGPANVFVQGGELNTDDLRVLIFIARSDAETTVTNLMPYRDLVPAAFAAKMSAFSTVNATQVMVVSGKPAQITWGSTQYDGWEFIVRVIRMVPRSYTA